MTKEENPNIIALENVLGLADEMRIFLYGNISEQTGISADQIIAEDSIEQVQAMLVLLKAGGTITTKEMANIELAKCEQGQVK